MSDAEEPRSTFNDYLQLTRAPNGFTAAADSMAGFIFAYGFTYGLALDAPQWGVVAVVACVSAAIYLAGTTLNDVFDLELDRRERPERPLPSGRISLIAAKRLGFGLLAVGLCGGVAVAAFVQSLTSGVLIVALAACVIAYDAKLKSTILGPLAMGACRTLNILFGMSATGTALNSGFFLVACGIGLYIVGVTIFAGTEATRSERRRLLFATAIMLAGLGVIAALPTYCPPKTFALLEAPGRWYILAVAMTLMTLWRPIKAIVSPTSADVQLAVVHCILSLIIFDAMLCYAAIDAFHAMLVTFFLFPTVLLSRLASMT